jgi:hypothetical protein
MFPRAFFYTLYHYSSPPPPPTYAKAEGWDKNVVLCFHSIPLKLKHGLLKSVESFKLGGNE